MVGIELRNDGWFEAGKNDKETWPAAYRCYLAKQEIKSALKGLRVNSMSELEVALVDIRAGEDEFHPPPYVDGSDLFVDTMGPPGKAYLGKIVEKL